AAWPLPALLDWILLIARLPRSWLLPRATARPLSRQPPCACTTGRDTCGSDVAIRNNRPAANRVVHLLRCRCRCASGRRRTGVRPRSVRGGAVGAAGCPAAA